MRSIRGLLVFFVVCFLAGTIGGTATGLSIQTWYASQRKPALTPPGWVFAPVWVVLYTMMAAAAWLHWRRARGTPIGRLATALFSVQLGLNALWSILFFGLRAPGLALADVGLLWASIAGWLAVSARIDRRAALLIAPYLAWVSFASYLNLRIWQLNR